LLKDSENPPISWPTDISIKDFSDDWFVVHTKSRNEKALAWDLVSKEISYFLPMCRKTSHSKGRKFKSLLPLFTGYMFFNGDENQRVEVLRTNRVANIIEVKDQQQLIKEIAEIEQALHAGADLKPDRYIKAGQLCEVTAGPLKGLKGIAQKTTTSMRLILNIDILGQAASVEIDSDLIEIIDE
jgi:transcriptional antiterminator RfaH